MENVAALADGLIGKQQRLAVSEGGRLDAFVNLLKIGNPSLTSENHTGCCSCQCVLTRALRDMKQALGGVSCGGL